MERKNIDKSRPAVSVNHIQKSFRVYKDKAVGIKDRLMNPARGRYTMHHVIKDVSFEVAHGEAVGIIGQNGCGKSTTLKMLTKIMYPDAGSIALQGRVSALIELGAGFHPDLSGRENIYTNAAIFGLSRKEIDERLQAIIDFSELGERIDNPVRTYSSGMYMRLAFSIAINVDADVLLVDEILAVGDAAFQSKCFQKMQELKAQGTTIVVVSHSLNQIEQICDRTIWIDQGVVRMEGRPADVHPAYLDYMGRHGQSGVAGIVDESGKRWGSREVAIVSVVMKDASGMENTAFKAGAPIRVELSYHRKNPEIQSAVFGFGLFRIDGTNCYGVNTFIDRLGEIPLKENGTIVIRLDPMNLLSGEYFLDVSIHKADGFPFDFWRESKRFKMYSDMEDIGLVRIAHKWEIL